MILCSPRTLRSGSAQLHYCCTYLRELFKPILLETLPRCVVETDGTVQVPAQTVPMSAFLSPEAKAYVTQHLKDMQDPEILKQDAGVPRFMKGYLARDYELFAVDGKMRKSAAYTCTSTRRKRRVGEEQRSSVDQSSWRRILGLLAGLRRTRIVPVSALGQIEVISVDYREGPDYKFPAASEDVAAVYQEMLKTHKPQNVGIYGCSAGGMQLPCRWRGFKNNHCQHRAPSESFVPRQAVFSVAMHFIRQFHSARRGYLHRSCREHGPP